MTDPDYFLLSELRGMPDLSSTTTFPDATCLDAAAYITGAIEAELDTSFIARDVTAEVHHGGVWEIQLRKSRVLSTDSSSGDATTAAISMTENGVAVDTATTYTLKVDPYGVLRRYDQGSWWATWFLSGYQNLTVTYKAGYSTTPPDDVKRMAMVGTRYHLLETQSNAMMMGRRMSISTDVGIEQFSVAGEKRPTGYPEVDAMIARWKRRLGPGFG